MLDGDVLTNSTVEATKNSAKSVKIEYQNIFRSLNNNKMLLEPYQLVITVATE